MYIWRDEAHAEAAGAQGAAAGGKALSSNWGLKADYSRNSLGSKAAGNTVM